MGLMIGVGSTKPTFPYDYYYGIEWDITVSNPKPTRIGKMELHKELPLQSMMRNCILKNDGSVAYYLHANDSTKQDNGAEADLTGATGQMETELPDMYVRFETDGNKCRHLQSTEPLPGFHLWRKGYIGSVEATVQRSTTTLASVCNTDADYRGGNNDATRDGTYRTMLGMPATNISLTYFRAYARKRGSTEWNCNLYRLHKMMWWLFAVEYANFNSQADFNAALDEKQKNQLLDEIEIELKVLEKEIDLAEKNDDTNKYRQLLRMQKKLQHEYQRIKYKRKTFTINIKK